MPDSKDKYLDDMLAIQSMVQTEKLVKVLRANPGAGDILCGLAVRELLKAVSPSIVRKLDKIGLSPGKGEVRLVNDEHRPG